MTTKGARIPPRGGVRLWPWSPKTAFWTSAGLLTLLLLGYDVLNMGWKWPSEKIQGPILLAILILGLLPVILLLVTFLASSGATLKGPGGLELSFDRAVSQAASTVQTTTLSENLGTTVSTDPSTSLSSVLRALRRSHASDVTIVDLRAGRTWWESRLMILIAGAARRGRPTAISFIGDLNATSGIFLGWAQPDRLVQAQLAADPELRSAWRRANAFASQWDCGLPLSDSTVQLPWNAQLSLPPMMDDTPDPDFAFEMFLQRELEGSPALNRKTFVSHQRLLELYEPHLITDSLDDTTNDDQWAKALTQRPHRYFAVTSNSKFRALVPREVLMSILTARLVSQPDSQ